jgi:hypothetical protein
MHELSSAHSFRGIAVELDDWKKLFGKNQNDPALKSALAAAGVKRIPKLDEDDTDVRFPIKGTGLEVIMTDEAFLKDLDQEVGEGPLILSGVIAKCGKSHGRDMYAGALPNGITPAMSREDVRSVLGGPTSKDDELFVDIWAKKQLETVVRYSRDGKSISTFALMLPGAE